MPRDLGPYSGGVTLFSSHPAEIQSQAARAIAPVKVGNTLSQKYISWEKHCLSNAVLRSTASLEYLIACIFFPFLP